MQDAQLAKKWFTTYALWAWDDTGDKYSQKLWIEDFTCSWDALHHVILAVSEKCILGQDDFQFNEHFSIRKKDFKVSSKADWAADLQVVYEEYTETPTAHIFVSPEVQPAIDKHWNDKWKSTYAKDNVRAHNAKQKEQAKKRKGVRGDATKVKVDQDYADRAEKKEARPGTIVHARAEAYGGVVQRARRSFQSSWVVWRKTYQYEAATLEKNSTRRGVNTDRDAL